MVEINQLDSNGYRTGFWIDNYTNSAPYSEGEYLHNEEHGPWIFYNPNRTIWCKGNFINGAGDGLWTFNNLEGQFKEFNFYARD